MIQARQQASGLQNICLTHILPSANYRGIPLRMQ